MGKTHYLVTKYRDKYQVFSPDTYGATTWGSTSQESLEKKKKYWYIVCWHAGSEWEEDYTEQYKLNVVFETTSVFEIFRYLEDHGCKDYEVIIAQVTDIIVTNAKIQKSLNKVEKTIYN